MRNPTERPVTDWQADLELSEAEAAAGLIVSAEPALNRLRASIERLENKQSAAPAQPQAAPRR